MFSKVSGIDLPYEIVARRAGDIAEYWSNATKAKTELNWQAKRELKEMITDSWRWQRQNPDGFDNHLVK